MATSASDSVLRFEVNETDQRTVVRPVGVLGLANHRLLRDFLLKCTTDEPAALIVELDELWLETTTALNVFSSVWMQICDWPGVPLLLVATDEQQYGLVLTSTVSRFLPVHPSLDAAVASLRSPPDRRRATRRLPVDPLSSWAARAFVREVCADWQLQDLTLDAAAIATELVENALLHTQTQATLRLESRRGVLTVAVADGAPGHPVLREGRGGLKQPSGLGIVAALARAWGCNPAMNGGKVVWATLRHPTP